MSLTIEIAKATIAYVSANLSAIDTITHNTDYDVTANLIFDEEAIVIEDAVENEKLFTFIPSSVDLVLHNLSSTVEGLLEDLGDRTQFLALKIYNGSTIHFHGWINAAKYDLIDETWLIGAVDFNKFIIEEYMPRIYRGTSIDMGVVESQVTVYSVLGNMVGGTTYGYTDLYFMDSIDIDVGTVISTALDATDMTALETAGMSYVDFLKEMQKHFAAYFYIDTGGVARFINRMEVLNTTAVAIDDDILDDTFTRTIIQGTKYDSLLVNCYGDWDSWNGDLGSDVHTHYEGWAILWYEDGEPRTMVGVNADLSNIESVRRFLDLRQMLPDASYTWKVFGFVDADDKIDAFHDVIIPTEIYECVVNRIDIPTMKKVSIDSANYQVTMARKNLYTETSELILKKL